jgi:hypothetical protein
MSAVVAAMIAVSVPAGADDDWRRVTVYDEMVSLEIPETWHEISPELLEFLSLRTAEVTGGKTTETYQAGFRPADMEVGFDLPQVLIQIRESGRLSYGQFMRLPSSDEVNRLSGDQLSDDGGPFVDNILLDDLAFDTDRMALLMTTSMDLAIEGPTAVRTASFLTERGVFVVHGYELADRIGTTGPIFERIISSVEFADPLAYQRRWSDGWTSRHTSLVFFVVAALAALTAVIIHRRQLRTDPGPRSSPP